MVKINNQKQEIENIKIHTFNNTDLSYEDIKKGNEIRDKVFDGNSHKQLSIIRQSIWALAVLNNNIESTDEEKTKADEILKESIEKNQQVEKLINEYSEKNDIFDDIK